MKILGVSASCRAWGNTDLLVQHALVGARTEGAETRFVRLADLQLGPCRGCMACVFKERDCVVDDRLHELLAAMRWADGFVFGSPAYVLGATGTIKNLQDRLIRFGIHREFVGRSALVVAAAGVPGWEPFTLAQIALLPLFLGMRVVDQFVGYAQGPGEILDDTDALARATGGGAALALGETGFRGDGGACPVCHLDLVVRTGNDGGRCPLCDLTGTWGDDGRLIPAPGAEPRWSEGSMRHHFADRILPSGPRFRERVREIRERVAAFRQEVGA